ncbi:MAG: CDP-glycerol:poly(Glycerophosphate)glycerophosph otransferase [Candidatus Daviesbacteria bacterium GW2011_GWA2_38_24]|uniref:CDP-glycerol:poly(Glycerophosphate)glycerophosph otransferase n=1 Tax=Candidatus Daviesbacteria bacterium GW2011_GWA2_38_24 TaxID=1618422 RepID=A0A0G0M0P0_9BACT|nr:MAG: CDP-glycerol:poly(Glycerophosphate)glycerophosph otransferase [Candidatus Daviesbacteria bacterium GW2011_GWA2_38_24]KKQ81026.1 MAG: CDP-glycerol:poly(Glycerophosphate)glycerophosph otransferase [Candidatus Daviesbacteria bacterium GW2011_GWA1_38_7]
MEVFHLLLYWVAVRMPLDNNIWIFGAWFGESYNDNSKYLFEYVKNNYPDITSVWLSRNRNVVRDLQKRGFKAYYFYNPLGLWYALRAGVAIFSVGYSGDLPGFCIYSSKKLIQLWHGIGTKKIGVMNTKQKDTNKKVFPYIQNSYLVKIVLRLSKILFGSTVAQINHLTYKLELYQNYTYFPTLSPSIKKMAVESFDIPEDKVIVTGSPRNDALFDKKINIAGKVADIIEDIHKKGGSVGFYMPTHRQEGGEEMIKTITDNLELCQDLLEEKNIYLLVKLHQFHQHESSSGVLKNIIYVSSQDLDGDIYPYLPKTDFLITDYSTIYIDYLLVDKPTIFLNYDFDRYTDMDRELYFPYEKVTPGPKVSSWEKLVPTISEQLKKDTYKKDRQEMRQFFHTYTDGESSKRIAEKIYNQFVLEKSMRR